MMTLSSNSSSLLYMKTRSQRCTAAAEPPPPIPPAAADAAHLPICWVPASPSTTLPVRPEACQLPAADCCCAGLHLGAPPDAAAGGPSPSCNAFSGFKRYLCEQEWHACVSLACVCRWAPSRPAVLADISRSCLVYKGVSCGSSLVTSCSIIQNNSDMCFHNQLAYLTVNPACLLC